MREQLPDEARNENTHIRSLRPVSTPEEIKRAHPATDRGLETVENSRSEIRSVLNEHPNSSDKLVVVTGGCSVHDVDEALEYTDWLAQRRLEYGEELELVQRVYFEKPRTTIGWEGLINDPHLDESNDINYGLMAARKLLVNITDKGVPVGTELLDTTTVQYYAGLVSWGAIGARTTESQLHRHLASGLSFPMGFKNGTGGNIKVAVDAVKSAQSNHHFTAIDDEGKLAIATTDGNPDCHIILRGGSSNPNYDADHVKHAASLLKESGLNQNIMIDASHANSLKNHKNQIVVVEDAAEQINNGSNLIMGVMIESNLVEGKQDFRPGQKHEYGVSITDACVGLEETEKMLQILRDAVKKRREL